jgi:hypothetical protein
LSRASDYSGIAAAVAPTRTIRAGSSGEIRAVRRRGRVARASRRDRGAARGSRPAPAFCASTRHSRMESDLVPDHDARLAAFARLLQLLATGDAWARVPAGLMGRARRAFCAAARRRRRPRPTTCGSARLPVSSHHSRATAISVWFRVTPEQLGLKQVRIPRPDIVCQGRQSVACD